MTTFTSGTQAIQGRTVNHDPEPWQAFDMLGNDYPHRVPDDNGEALSAARLRMGYRCDPRPEYAVLDNPILAQLRKLIAGGMVTRDEAVAILARSNFDQPHSIPATYKQISHARRVLAKLAALNETEEQ